MSNLISENYRPIMRFVNMKGIIALKDGMKDPSTNLCCAVCFSSLALTFNDQAWLLVYLAIHGQSHLCRFIQNIRHHGLILPIGYS